MNIPEEIQTKIKSQHHGVLLQEESKEITFKNNNGTIKGYLLVF